LKYRLVIWLTAGLVSSQVSSAEYKPILKACGHHDYAPWNWLQDDKIVGVCAQVATELFGSLGYDIDLTYVGPWKRCQLMIERGEVDLNICSFKNSYREGYSVFSSVPMATNENAIFVNKDNYFDYKNLETLKGKLIGLVRGVSLGNEIDGYLTNNSHVIRVKNYQALLSMLKLNRIDVVILGRQSGRHLLNLYGLNNEIVDLPEALVKGDLYFSFSKKSPHNGLLVEVNKTLKSDEYRVWLASLFERYSQMHKEYKQNMVSRIVP
jgi:polar amino acid transport system substrate-binding protein